jgi:hypothetical protein
MKNLIISVAMAVFLSACGNNAANMEAEIAKAKQHTLDSIRVADSLKTAALQKQKTIDSLKAVVAENQKKEATGTAATPKKKKWSSTAKGAVIGAGVGAIGGAIIDKKHGEGAVVGGLIGAGVGAGTGAVIDSKKKKEAQKTPVKQ